MVSPDNDSPQPVHEGTSGLPPLPYQWEPLLEVVDVLHHPNFHWSVMGGGDLKYLNLRIDTRDNRCVIEARDGRVLTLAELREYLAHPTIPGMNDNSPVEITIKPKLD